MESVGNLNEMTGEESENVRLKIYKLKVFFDFIILSFPGFIQTVLIHYNNNNTHNNNKAERWTRMKKKDKEEEKERRMGNGTFFIL